MTTISVDWHGTGNAHATHDPRALLAPEPKLLTAPLSEHESSDGERALKGSDAPHVEPHTLTDADLERLAEKIAGRGKKNDKPFQPSLDSFKKLQTEYIDNATSGWRKTMC
jgi:hypothetical protein